MNHFHLSVFSGDHQSVQQLTKSISEESGNKILQIPPTTFFFVQLKHDPKGSKFTLASESRDDSPAAQQELIH